MTPLHRFWNPFSNDLIPIFSLKIAEHFADFLQNVAKFVRILLNFLLNFDQNVSGFSQNAATFTSSIFQGHFADEISTFSKWIASFFSKPSGVLAEVFQFGLAVLREAKVQFSGAVG